MKIRIQDSSSLGSILLLHLLQGSKQDVDLVWTGKFLESHRAVEIGGLPFNNGYHVFEMPRSKNLVRALCEITGVRPVLHDKSSWLSFGGVPFESTRALAQWPRELTEKIVRSRHNDGGEDFSEALEQALRPFGSRFADDWLDARHLFLPWFLPADLVQPDRDEGAKFRFAVRSGALEQQVAVFGDGLMESLRLLIRRGIENIGEVQESQTADLQRRQSTGTSAAGDFDPGNGDRAFILAVYHIGKQLPEAFGLFDEILFAASEAPDLNRSWFHQNGEDFFLVNEIFSRNQAPFSISDANHLSSFLGTVLGIDLNRISYFGSRVSRTINVSKLRSMRMWESEFLISQEGDVTTVTAVSLGTANMNKVWEKAVTARDKVIEIGKGLF